MEVTYSRSKGFTLIAALLMLLLMSGLAVGLMFMTNTEVRVGGNDLENNLAFYGAEAGMEKMTSDLSNLYGSNQAPTVANITGLSAFPPSNVPGINYTEYNFNVPVDAQGKPVTNVDNVKSGPNQGLIAEIIPMTLSVTANRASGAQVRMQRAVEVALIPVFQFGVFSDTDLSYFPGPFFDFAGRVHTNGNLFLAESDANGLVFHSKLTAAGEIVRDKLSNGVDVVSDGRNGPVYAPNTAGGCDVSHPSTNCLALGVAQGSYLGGPPPTGSPNPAWVGISTGTYNGWILNGKTGATKLQLPFIAPGVLPIEIIRKPPANEAPGSAMTAERLYGKAQIRVLFADNLANLHPERGAGALDAEDVMLNHEAGTTYPTGVTVTGMPGGGKTFFAYASTAAGNGPYYDPNTEQIDPPKYPARTQWPIVDGWLRVEIKKANGTWVGVTNEWLTLGFARGLTPPASAAVHPNAILMFQMLADRDGSGAISGGRESASPNTSRYNWYPINLYDAREGEIRDNDPGLVGAAATCAANGVMNVVELDVGNLRRWLTGAIGATGTQVDSQTLNGYLLYFADRRGMLPDPNVIPGPAVLTGEYGFEDAINAASVVGTPDNALDPYNPGTTQSPEDVDKNGLPDNWGAKTVQDAFKTPAPSLGNAPPYNPYVRYSCLTLGRKNQMTAARHALKLVDGVLGKLPTRPDGTGGFTVGSENPVYVVGDYNANNGYGAGNAAAAVIADAVTLLSKSWTDFNSLSNPTTVTNRNAATTYYRVAIAAGKNVSFPKPAWAAASDYGTDGGVHNFLRYLEDWSGPGATLNYNGSLVSLYYSNYATGVFKCCTTVYGAPTRNYQFDVLFLDPANLPPGTPVFQDVNNVSYRQDFTPY